MACLSLVFPFAGYGKELVLIMIFKESKTIYLQIADRIMDEILQKVYLEQERIPSVRDYAAMVEVNPNTVVRTYEYLQGRQIIFNKRGLGYFVEKGALKRIQALRKEVFLREELPEMCKSMKVLGITPDDIASLYKEYLEKE